MSQTKEGEDPGVLMIGFSDDESLERIAWDEFFDKFEGSDLAFLHQDTTADGQGSRFFKFVRR